MRKLRWLTVLMVAVILVIAGFQVYWLLDNYARERKAVQGKAQFLFRETIREVQDSTLQSRVRSVILDSTRSASFTGKLLRNASIRGIPQVSKIVSLLTNDLVGDSAGGRQKKGGVYVSVNNRAEIRTDPAVMEDIFLDTTEAHRINGVMVYKNGRADRGRMPRKERLMTMRDTFDKDSTTADSSHINTIYLNSDHGEQIVIRLDSLFTEALPVPVIEAAYSRKLNTEKLSIPFTIVRDSGNLVDDEQGMSLPFVTKKFAVKTGNLLPYLVKRIAMPILFSFFLVSLTVICFILLYRSLRRQQRLAEMKNDLISNITHELKTPIATVGVAIEALKNFNAIQDPQRTKEYLDISQNELQRLGLLVDKVLKLSMFENKKIEIKKEVFNLGDVVSEVVASLRLQAEKSNARITVERDGDLSLAGDRTHLLSVVFNLLDNALKYSKGNAAIAVDLRQAGDAVVLKVTDNGIGIPGEYKDKIFEKFFRVPAGDTHNAKGHGLGLSYVAQVVRQHQGKIELVSHEGLGSTFTITLPKSAGA